MQQRETKQSAARLRVERPEDPEISEEDSSTWAVSYSDLLMVLMSFFVMFFQFTPEKTQTIIQQLAVSVGTKGEVGGGSPPPEPKPEAGPGTSGGMKATLTTTIIEALKAANLEVSVEQNADSLAILLPDDIYRPRGFKVSDELKKTLTEVMEMIRPHANELDIYFVGHADADPLSKGNEYLTDNFSLSALRATHALQFALAAGFPKTHLFAQGGAENGRNSRTLSVKVRPHKAED